MFASRTDWPLTLNPLSALIQERRGQGLPIIDLTESNPTRCGFSLDAQGILAALANPRSLAYQPDPRGLLSARQAVAGYYAERGTTIAPEQIFLTTSTSEAYSFVFRLLANPGDNILVPRPSYPLLDFLARLNDLELVPYPMIYDHGWQIDLQTLAAQVKPGTRAVLAVHPNNPTGSFVHREELEFLIGCCRAQPLALIADEVFADYAFADYEPRPRDPESGERERAETPAVPGESEEKTDSVSLQVAGLPHFGQHKRSGTLASSDRVSSPLLSKPDLRVASFAAVSEVLTFTLSGLSKISGLPQMKLAWVIVNGPPDLLPTALARLELISDTYLSVSAPLAYALPKFLESGRQVQRQIMSRVQRNLRWLDEQLPPGCAVSRLKTEGGWYVILRVPAVRSDEEWAMELLRKEGVLVHPGHFYDLPYESHLVLSLLPAPEFFQPGIRKILARSGLIKG